MHWVKKGFIYKAEKELNWWTSHTMAPAAFLLDKNTIRVYIGCWDKNKISRIGYIDLDVDSPNIIKNKSNKPVLDIGEDGCFDDNGVFPAHVYKYNDTVYLYYTGFQKLEKIPFLNFSGLAISNDNGNSFTRVSKVPVMDRADEGLFTRGGTSVFFEDSVFKTAYSTGSNWVEIAGKKRPTYEIYYQESNDGISFSKAGKLIIEYDRSLEHGLGRPQITKIYDLYYIFYTKRTINFDKYSMGVAKSKDLKTWVREDNWLESIKHGQPGEFDSNMVYFPCFLDTGNKKFLFYVGNGYGEEGLGYAELIEQ